MKIPDQTPPDPTYRSDFCQSVDMFEKSFQGMQASKFDAQRTQYVKVMHESLKTMQESANAMFNQHLLQLKQTLDKDLQTYLSTPTEENKEKIQTDIKKLKRAE